MKIGLWYKQTEKLEVGLKSFVFNSIAWKPFKVLEMKNGDVTKIETHSGQKISNRDFFINDYIIDKRDFKHFTEVHKEQFSTESYISINPETNEITSADSLEELKLLQKNGKVYKFIGELSTETIFKSY